MVKIILYQLNSYYNYFHQIRPIVIIQNMIVY